MDDDDLSGRRLDRAAFQQVAGRHRTNFAEPRDDAEFSGSGSGE